MRLGRVVDRVRSLSEKFEELVHGQEDLELYEERRALIFDQLDKLTSRARILKGSMMILLHGARRLRLDERRHRYRRREGTRYSWLPVVMGVSSALCLCYGSMLLIAAARLAGASLSSEMDFIWQLGKVHAPAALVTERSPHHNRLTLRRRP